MCEDDRFRICVYCNADDGVDERQHAEDCPTNTGVYPVCEEDFGPECIHCGRGAFGGMRCMDCGHDLVLGDFYMHRTVDEGDPLLPGMEGAPVYEIVCVGCKATEALADA